MPSSTASCSIPAGRWTWRSRVCTPRPGRACSRPRSASTRRSRAADKAALFKTFTKVLAQRRGSMATFMAKWSRDWPGQSGHIHLSLQGRGRPAGLPRRQGGAARHEPDDALVRRRAAEAHARAARHGGLDGELLHAADPRLLGADLRDLGRSRTAPRRCASFRAVREAQRVEYRIAAADVNPYIALAAALAQRAVGHRERRSSPSAPIEGNAYDGRADPASATCRARCGRRRSGSKARGVARDLFGDAFVDHYAATREWEEREFRKAHHRLGARPLFRDHLRFIRHDERRARCRERRRNPADDLAGRRLGLCRAPARDERRGRRRARARAQGAGRMAPACRRGARRGC